MVRSFPGQDTTFLRDFSKPHILLSGLHGNPPNMFFHVAFLNSYHLDDWICCYPKSGAWKGRRPRISKDNKHFRKSVIFRCQLFAFENPFGVAAFCFRFSNRTEPHRGCLCAGFTINCTYNPDFIRACTRVSFLCDPVLRCLKSVLWSSYSCRTGLLNLKFGVGTRKTMQNQETFQSDTTIDDDYSHYHPYYFFLILYLLIIVYCCYLYLFISLVLLWLSLMITADVYRYQWCVPSYLSEKLNAFFLALGWHYATSPSTWNPPPPNCGLNGQLPNSPLATDSWLRSFGSLISLNGSWQLILLPWKTLSSNDSRNNNTDNTQSLVRQA